MIMIIVKLIIMPANMKELRGLFIEDSSCFFVSGPKGLRQKKGGKREKTKFQKRLLAKNVKKRKKEKKKKKKKKIRSAIKIHGFHCLSRKSVMPSK